VNQSESSAAPAAGAAPAGGEELRVLLVGDVVGEPGRKAIKQLVPELRRKLALDFVVVNAENAAGGSGVTPAVVAELLGAGCDVLTLGDHAFRNRDGLEVIESEPRLLRPLNLSAHAAGRGHGLFTGASGARYGVASLLGRVFMNTYADSPFDAADRVATELGAAADFILVDFHAEATSEKIAMRYHLDGRVAVLVGTHTHVPTADAQVTPRGTAYLSDLGMTGPHESVLGRNAEAVVQALRTQMPERFHVAKGDVRLNGLLVRLDRRTHRAVGAERVERKAE